MSKGSYAAVKFDQETCNCLTKYQEDNNIPNAIKGEHYHSTVMFSRKFIPDFETIGKVKWSGMFLGFGIFEGKDGNSLVLKFRCNDLEERFNHIMVKYGATWDYEDFIPHITLSYNVGDLDYEKLPSYKGPINIIYEYYEDLDLNWTTSINWQ